MLATRTCSRLHATYSISIWVMPWPGIRWSGTATTSHSAAAPLSSQTNWSRAAPRGLRLHYRCVLSSSFSVCPCNPKCSIICCLISTSHIIVCLSTMSAFNGELWWFFETYLVHFVGVLRMGRSRRAWFRVGLGCDVWRLPRPGASSAPNHVQPRGWRQQQ